MSTISSLYQEKELDIYTSLEKISKIISPDFGLITSFRRIRQYHDEPKFWNFSASLNPKYSKNSGRNFEVKASGFSFFSKEEALLKCLSESIERYCNFVFLKKSTSFTGSYKQIKDKALDPRSFVSFSKKQLSKSKVKRSSTTEKSKFRWTKCISLENGKTTLVPSQLIYLSYPFLKEEPIIYLATSTGVAAGSCLSGSLLRAIYEIIERDAFMIYYLNKLKAPRIHLKHIKNEKVRSILAFAKRYKLQIISLDITTDLGVPTIVSIVIDLTGIGKAVSVGAKSNLNTIDALLGSMTEAFHTRTWIREEYERNPKKIERRELLKHTDLKTRGFLWYPIERIKKLDFWIKSPKTVTIREDEKTHTSGEQLKRLLKILSNLNLEVFHKDLTISQFKELDYFVIKAIIPQLHPLHLNENYLLLGGRRVKEVPKKLGYKKRREDELNTFPHPFL